LSPDKRAKRLLLNQRALRFWVISKIRDHRCVVKIRLGGFCKDIIFQSTASRNSPCVPSHVTTELTISSGTLPGAFCSTKRCNYRNATGISVSQLCNAQQCEPLPPPNTPIWSNSQEEYSMKYLSGRWIRARKLSRDSPSERWIQEIYYPFGGRHSTSKILRFKCRVEIISSQYIENTFFDLT